jgi:hypothetical protein
MSDLESEIPDGDPAGACDVSGPESTGNHDGFDFEIPFPPPSPPDSPSRESEASGLNVEYHPIINGQYNTYIYIHFSLHCAKILGEPCDIDGSPLDRNSPEPTIKDPDDWTPYDSRLAFETAEFAYKRCKMSAGNFDTLSQLWAASLAPYNDAPPFSCHSDLCKTIDSTPIGGVPWQNIALSYNGVKPDNAPPWMQAEYTVWYRDPRMLFKNMLENPEFADHFDYAPSRKYNAEGDRVYEDFMSSDWAWKQAVSVTSIFIHP